MDQVAPRKWNQHLQMTSWWAASLPKFLDNQLFIVINVSLLVHYQVAKDKRWPHKNDYDSEGDGDDANDNEDNHDRNGGDFDGNSHLDDHGQHGNDPDGAYD